MIILEICENPDILRIMRLIRISIQIIRIIVPLLLIISLMYTIIKTFFLENLDRQKHDLESITSSALKKALAAILVFFIPTFVIILIDASGQKNLGYSKCFSNATSEYIANAYMKEAQTYINVANKTLSRSDYNTAKVALEKAKSASASLKAKEDKASTDNTPSGGGAGGGNIHYRINPFTTDQLLSNDYINLCSELEEVDKKITEKEEEIKEEKRKAEEQRKKELENRKNNIKINYEDLNEGPDKFYAKYNGTATDADGAYGYQCVDGFKVWLKEYGYPVVSTPNGFADGYWYSKDALGFSKYFDYIRYPSEYRNGDWVLWPQGSGSHPYSHVAMYYNGKAFGQRQSCDASRAFCLKSTNFSDSAGALRPKIYYKK